MQNEKKLVAAIDHLEDVLANYFADKDIPLEVTQAIGDLEEAMIEAELSPLTISGLAQRQPHP